MKSNIYTHFRKPQSVASATPNIVKKRFLCFGLAIGVAAIGLAVTVVFALTPANGGVISGAPVLINTSPGNQTDPHVSGDIAAYTDEATGMAVIRYYDFLTSAPGSIFTPMGSTDQLSDVNGNYIAFARQT